MHTFSENSSGVPAFLAKLWRLVEDDETNNLIYWSSDGKSFIIQNQAQFAREILPLNYKHNNMASFIRQLNMYGFHKITSLDGGGLKFDRDEMEFSHPYFQRDHPYLLEHIKRKISTAKTSANVDDKSNVKHEIVSKVLNDVKLMKGRQESLDNRFLSIKQENEALWREVALLRQKHMKQQQIVNKLIQFLVTIVQPQRGSGIGSMGGMSGVKRRYQLMINDIPDVTAKTRKTSTSSRASGNEGPIIHELTEELLENYTDGGEDDVTNVNSPYVVSPGSFPTTTINDYEEIENIDDADQIIAEEDDVATTAAATTTTNTAATMASLNNEHAGNVYNTADYTADLIYDLNKTPSLITNTAGTSNVDDIPVEELLENVPTGVVPEQLATFIKRESKQKQPIHLIQTPATNLKQTNNQKLFANKKQIPANVIIANASGNVQGMKRLPILKIASNPNNQTTVAGIRQANACGKSLIDAQKLKAVKQQQQQQQQQQLGQPKQVVQTIPQPGNKPILITVGKAQTPNVSTASIQQNAAAAAAAAAFGKTYKNKDDFISSEIPAELFEDDDGNFDGNNMINNANTQMNADQLTGNFGQQTNPSTSGVGGLCDTYGKDLTVAKYNKGTTHEDIMRINSPDQFHNHLDNVQSDLETLKEFLRDGDNYQVDANTLLNLFGENDVFQQYGIPMNPTDTTTIPGLEEQRQRNQNDGTSMSPHSTTGSELISYQQGQNTIDFTDFLNLDDSQLTSGSLTSGK